MSDPTKPPNEPTAPTPAPALPPGIVGGYTVVQHANGGVEIVVLQGTSAYSLLALTGYAQMKVLDMVRDYETEAKRKEAAARTPFGRAKARLHSMVSRKERKRLEKLAKDADDAARSKQPPNLAAVPDPPATPVVPEVAQPNGAA